MIDSHHHFWWHKRHAYTWPPAAGDRFARDYTPDDLRPELKACGIEGTVLIQVLQEAETEEFLDICRDVGFRARRGRLAAARRSGRHRQGDRAAAGARRQARRRAPSHRNEPDPKWLLQDRVVESLKLLARAEAGVRRHPDQRRADGVGADRRAAAAGAEHRDESSRPAADPGPRLGAVGDAGGARRRVPQRLDEAVDRPRHHHALALERPTRCGAIPTTCSTCSARIVRWRRATGR